MDRPAPHPGSLDPDTPEPARDHAADLAAVRTVLVGPETARLNTLDKKLADTAWHVQNVAATLPDAITLRTSKDDRIARALAPTIESSIRTSVQKNPKPLVDAISPVMGPAIRKSISDALQGFVQRFNETLASPFSREGLSCLIESWRSGQSFGAVRLKRSLVYRVEQVFLVHREAGLVLQHVAADHIQAQDADMVSGMLTAIRDFAKDSFGVQEGSGLDSFRIGDLNCWVEQGPAAILAAAIRGTPAHAFRATLQEAFERISTEHAAHLAEFQGDAAPFITTRPILEACLREETQRAPRKRSFPFFWLALLILLPLLAWWAVRAWSLRALLNEFLDWSKGVPGYVVTRVGTDPDGRPLVIGLRDALAPTPESFFQTKPERDRARIATQLEPYFSLDARLVERRAVQTLRPASAKGSVALALNGATLTATGTADHAWVAAARRLATTVPGVSAYDDRGLIDTDQRQLAALRDRVESLSARFPFASSDLAESQVAVVGDMAVAVLRLTEAARSAGIDFQVQVIGHTDSSGQEERNVRLSRDRADRVISLLVARGVATRELAAVGVGPAQPKVAKEATDKDREQNRRVSLRVLFFDQPLFLDPGRAKP